MLLIYKGEKISSSKTDPGPVGMTSITETEVSAPTLRKEIFRDKLDIDTENQYMVINL